MWPALIASGFVLSIFGSFLILTMGPFGFIVFLMGPFMIIFGTFYNQPNSPKHSDVTKQYCKFCMVEIEKSSTYCSFCDSDLN